MAARGRRAQLLLLIALVAAAAGFVRAGEGPSTPAATKDSGVVAAPAAKATSARSRLPAGTLTVFNRPIVTFRSTVLGVSPQDRALSAQTRILALLERGGEGRITVESIDVGNVVKIDGGLAFIIAESDLEPLSGETLGTVTDAAVSALTKAIAETREVRDARLMLAAAIWAGGATAVYLVLLVILRFVGRAVTRRMLHLADVAAEKVRIGGTVLVNRSRAIGYARHLLHIGYWAIVLLLTYQWVGFVLGRFPFTRPWGEQLNTFLVATTLDMLTAIAESMPELLIVAVIFFLARTANNLLRNFFDGVQSHRIDVSWLDEDTARPTRRIVEMVLWLFALVMAYPYLPGRGHGCL